HLQANHVEELVMAGHIQKPSMAQLMPDARALKILGAGLLHRGDDSLLSTIVHALESEEGFRFVGAHEVMPELLAPEGLLGSVQPNEAQHAAIIVAVHAAKDLGAKDLGQAAVASARGVVALEERAGTDAMLESLFGNTQAQGAVLAKMVKPDQETRADLPTIGVHTVENAARAGLGGIVVEAGGALILDRAAVVKTADAKGLFVMGVKANA
ncbi:MAG: UDP-2,3-diacylglucosamine diphosphatase LpxI, partial [Rhodospirillales bacterium]|nr:UDP-2,3-diacylglucosamine diphosphatase LpxI [Rhodospirillales bacterium]